MLVIRDLPNTHSTDSSTLFSELGGDVNLDNLHNHPLNLYTSTDPYVQQNVASPTSYIFPAHNGLGSFGTDGPRKNIQGYNQLSKFEQYIPKCIKCGRESFGPTCLELIRQKAQKIERNRRIETWRLEQSQYLSETIRTETKYELEVPLQNLTPTITTSSAAKSTFEEAASDAFFLENGQHDEDIAVPAKIWRGLRSYITENIILNFMGIDARLLMILFGEALPDDDSIPGGV